MNSQKDNIQITFGNQGLKGILNEILEQEFIKLLNKEESKV